MKENPLVTVRVSAYNSSEFILETLDSIYAQTYQNLELIISDDCSTDDTIKVCTEWLEVKKNRFVESVILTSPINTGIPANINRAIKASKGEWIKGIAADDMLLPNCIQTNVDFINQNKKAFIIGSNVHFLCKQSDTYEIKNEDIFHKLNRSSFSEFKSSDDQWKSLLKSYCISTPTLFISRKVYSDIMYDETFLKIEDYPFMLNALRAGYKYTHIPTETVLYRIHYSSIYHKSLDTKLFNSFYKTHYEFDKAYRLPYMGILSKLDYYYNFGLKSFFDKVGLNKKRRISKLLYKIFYYINICNLYRRLFM